MVFQCHRCFYYTKNRKDMRKHLNRKHKCSRIIDSYNYKEEKIEELSLINRNELIIIKSNDFISENNNDDIKNKCILAQIVILHIRVYFAFYLFVNVYIL